MSRHQWLNSLQEKLQWVSLGAQLSQALGKLRWGWPSPWGANYPSLVLLTPAICLRPPDFAVCQWHLRTKGCLLTRNILCPLPWGAHKPSLQGQGWSVTKTSRSLGRAGQGRLSSHSDFSPCVYQLLKGSRSKHAADAKSQYTVAVWAQSFRILS